MAETDWSALTDSLGPGRALRHRIRRGDEVVSYGHALECWQHDVEFRDFFGSLLAGSPWPACYFETPPIDRSTLNRAFEFVLIESRLLAGAEPEPDVFSEYFESSDAGDGICTFANLGGDAVLVAPCPAGPPDAYAHLSAFVRGAPSGQQHALWRHVGRAAESWIRARPQPLWISTAGQGVFWLHVRLDRRPKYYNFPPYRET